MDLPLEILKIPHDDIGTHLFLTYKYIDPVTNEEEWRILDPTWHPVIRRSVNVNGWDGIHATTMAITPISFPKRIDPTDTDGLAELFDTSWIAEDLEKNTGFYIALNKYFESLETNDTALGNNYHHPSEQAGYPYP